MQKVLVDTDVVSYLFKQSPESREFRLLLKGKLACISFVSVGELLRGAYEANWSGRRLEALNLLIEETEVLGYEPGMAEMYARAMAASKKQGRSMESHVNDAWIAATALAYQLPLLTNNRRHFEHVPGLALL